MEDSDLCRCHALCVYGSGDVHPQEEGGLCGCPRRNRERERTLLTSAKAAAMKAQGLDPATAPPQRVDVAVIGSTPVATPATPAAAPVKPEPKADIGPVEGPWTKFKSWALSGMTPADKEYKTAFERARDEERVQAEKVVAPVVAAATREGTDAGERLGADNLVKGEKTKGESGSILSSVTGWWSGR
jgi:hypothetical protein